MKGNSPWNYTFASATSRVRKSYETFQPSLWRGRRDFWVGEEAHDKLSKALRIEKVHLLCQWWKPDFPCWYYNTHRKIHIYLDGYQHTQENTQTHWNIWRTHRKIGHYPVRINNTQGKYIACVFCENPQGKSKFPVHFVNTHREIQFPAFLLAPLNLFAPPRSFGTLFSAVRWQKAGTPKFQG